MTNKEWLATLSAEDWFATIHWLTNVWGKRWTDTRSAIIAWLEEEHCDLDGVLMTQKEKPPLGVAPALMVAWQRIGELVGAIERQYQSDNGDPKLVAEWANEIGWQAAMIEALRDGEQEVEC